MATNPVEQEGHDLNDIFKPVDKSINYSLPNNEVMNTIALPTATDNLLEVAVKLEAFAQVIIKGDSLAVHAGHPADQQPLRDPIAIATQTMTPREITQYEFWASGKTMPHINWDTDRMPVRRVATRAHFELRAQAMNVIYECDRATPENAVWFTSKKKHMLPLLTAIVKIIKARNDLVANVAELDAAEMAATHDAVVNSRTVLDKNWATFKRLFDRIISASNTLANHEQTLKRKLNPGNLGRHESISPPNNNPAPAANTGC